MWSLRPDCQRPLKTDLSSLEDIRTPKKGRQCRRAEREAVLSPTRTSSVQPRRRANRTAAARPKSSAVCWDRTQGGQARRRCPKDGLVRPTRNCSATKAASEQIRGQTGKDNNRGGKKTGVKEMATASKREDTKEGGACGGAMVQAMPKGVPRAQKKAGTGARLEGPVECPQEDVQTFIREGGDRSKKG